MDGIDKEGRIRPSVKTNSWGGVVRRSGEAKGCCGCTSDRPSLPVATQNRVRSTRRKSKQASRRIKHREKKKGM